MKNTSLKLRPCFIRAHLKAALLSCVDAPEGLLAKEAGVRSAQLQLWFTWSIHCSVGNCCVDICTLAPEQRCTPNVLEAHLLYNTWRVMFDVVGKP